MVEECKETNAHGLFGWNAIPLALEDLDSNLVNIFMAGDVLFGLFFVELV
jgi:hypothetical protein